MDAIDNFQLPVWETEMSFHILEENLRIAEKLSGNSFIAIDCQEIDSSLCNTNLDSIYIVHITETIDTIKVGDQLEFEDKEAY